MISIVCAKTAKKIEKITFVMDSEIALEWDDGFTGIRKGDYVEEWQVKREMRRLRQYLYGKGYLKSKISYEKIAFGDGVELVVTISIEKVAKVVDLNIIADNTYLLKSYEKKIEEIKSKPFSGLRVKIILDEIGKDIFESGYYYSNISYEKKIVRDDAHAMDIEMEIRVKFGLQYNFHFVGNDTVSRFELMDFMRQGISTNKGDDPEKRMKSSILEKYENLGIYGTEIKIRSERVVSVNNDVVMKNFFVTIKEGSKVLLRNFVVEGNLAIPSDEVEKFYYKNSTSLASRGYFDKDYLIKFVDILKKEYLKRGFVLVDILNPEIVFYQNGNEASVAYTINERKQCILKKINIKGVSSELVGVIKDGLVNREGGPLNILEIESDIKKSMDIIRRKGYFFAKIENSLKQDLVVYGPKGVSAEINIDFDIGKKGRYRNVFIEGNRYTETHVIEREVVLEKNAIVTLGKIDSIREKINGLGLFSQVKVVPRIVNGDDSQRDFYDIELFIQVKEKNFGNAEFSLGYRTDIGIKLSAVISHNNLWKKHHSVSTKGQINQRLDYGSLDPRRRAEKNGRIEGLWEANYIWPYFH